MQSSAHSLLVVEDDVTVARALARSLSRRGFSVSIVGSCKSALALTQSFDVAILDLDLPDGNGVDLARQLLSSGTTPSVVFYTGSIHRALLTRARRVGPVLMKADGLAPVIACLAHDGADAPESRTAPSQKLARSPSPSASVRKSRAR